MAKRFRIVAVLEGDLDAMHKTMLRYAPEIAEEGFAALKAL